MRSRCTHLHLESLEQRLVAGSYFGGPTSGGGLTSPLAGFLGEPPTLIAANPAVRSYRPRTPPPAAADPSPAAGSLAVASPSRNIPNSPRAAPVAATLPASGRTTGAGEDLDPLRSLEAGLGLGTGLEPPGGKGLGVHPLRRKGFAGPDSGGGAAGSPATQGASGPGSAAPVHFSVPTAGGPVAANPVPVSSDQNLAVANALNLPGSGQGGSPDLRTTDGLTIPHHHPRIWWTPDRLAQAQDWYAQNPFVPSQDDPLGNALVYVLTGQSYYAGYAINSLMNFTISEGELQSSASDTYRWSDWVPVVYDWVHDAMSPDQRQTFMDRYNYYAAVEMQKSWGGPTMVANDYFWGRFRNEFNWAIATYYENPMAQTFLDDALITRWQNAFLPWAEQGEGLGGVTPEGTEYGKTTLSYPALPLVTAAGLGANLYQDTNFYKEAVFNLIYSTTPAPTYRKDWSGDPYYQPFVFGEEEHLGGYPSLQNVTDYGDFMEGVAAAYADEPVGQYAYHWLQTVQPGETYYTYPYYQYAPGHDGNADTPDFSALPVDYYAPGSQFFYTRDQWGPQATSVLLQLGEAWEGHHLDAGSFQIWRNSWFVSKNTAGYSLQINGGTSSSTIAQNGLLYEGQGLASSWQLYPPNVLRLQSAPDFSYAAVDLSGMYRSSYSTIDNPYESQTIREFIFIKPLQTLVILDRMQSSSDAIAAQDVSKTFLLHFPEQPQQDGAHSFIGYSGDQALRVTNLVPANATYNVVDESDFQGSHDPDPAFYQYRLEESTSGQAQSYFINVLQARDASGRNVTASMSQNANSWTITLNHPTLGHAKIVLNKGTFSWGGAVGYSATGVPTDLTPLLDHVQDIQVTDDGPVWGE